MPRTKKKKKKSGKNKKLSFRKTRINERTVHPAVKDLTRLEFHRNGFALIPNPSEKNPGIAFFLKGDNNKPDEIYCSCTSSGKKLCIHITELVELYRYLKGRVRGKTPDRVFRESLWYQIASILAENCTVTAQSVKLRYVNNENKKILKALDSDDAEILCYYSKDSDQVRFIERFELSSAKNSVPLRSTLLENLAQLTVTENERIMENYGVRSIGQELERTFWYRMAYHCYREFGTSGFTFHPAIEETSGEFTVTCKNVEDIPLFRMVIPREKVERILAAFKRILPNQNGLTIRPVPLRSIFKVGMDTELDLEIRPFIMALQEDGETKLIESETLKRFRYGNLVYLKDMGILAELEKPGNMARKFVAPVKMKLKKSQIPAFLNEFGDELKSGRHIMEASVKKLKIHSRSDSVEMTPSAIDRDWCWLSLKYRFGSTSISLGDILQAKKEGQRYLTVADGWVDCQSPDFEPLDQILEQIIEQQETDFSDSIKISRMNLFRLRATSLAPITVTGENSRVSILKKMLELKPLRPLKTLKGMTSKLRNYQVLGVDWLRFLYENGFGGLLCDDMGIGKTHQAMALMLAIREREKVNGPFIVICPTTVLSHWSSKISEHAPGLKTHVFHGGKRDLEEGLKHSTVLLTSYGIMRNDIEQLSRINFSLAVFDEIQNLKNPQTLAFHAAKKLQANVKLGMTGTPIENTLNELKALFDLTVPGYLGTEENFKKRYIIEIENNPDSKRRKELSKLVYPFILRRMKQSVLDELPEKIEDIRTCRLSDDQVKLYRDVISSRAKGLKEQLRKREEPVPYMHIFAVISLLKQICDHPSLVEGSVNDYDKFQSGKWELFKELISECMDSGQKVVVFSQFLGMIKIIENYFNDIGIDFVTLTGSTRNRGEVISRFNNDTDCRCYIGSLKAGGTGIDLVAATVVIHYDRWWNAAREDQATDRVHRIGQKSSVQVFKLVTEGTLEEKISAIIEKKRNLMDSIVKEDDPKLLKTFSREDFISMLSEPSLEGE